MATFSPATNRDLAAYTCITQRGAAFVYRRPQDGSRCQLYIKEGLSNAEACMHATAKGETLTTASRLLIGATIMDGKAALSYYDPDGMGKAAHLSATEPPEAAWTARRAWESWFRDSKQIKPRSKSEHKTSLNHWERLTDNPPLGQITWDILQEVESQLTRDPARKLHSTISMLLREIDKPLVIPRREQRKLRRKKSGGVGRAVTRSEFVALYNSADVAEWPRLGDIPPGYTWRTWLLMFWLYGARHQDFVAYRGKSDGGGLLWSSVRFASELPGYTAITSPYGWLDFAPAKVNNAEVYDEPTRVIVPIHKLLRPRLEQYRGLDDTRVFPNGYSAKARSNAFQAICKEAGVESDVSVSEAGKRSLRKSCNQNWNDLHAGLGEYALGHAPQSVNAAFYEDGARRTSELIGKYDVPDGLASEDQQGMLF